MKVRFIKTKTIEDFEVHNVGSKISFMPWLALLKWADWNRPGAILKTYRKADLLGNGCERVVLYLWE